MEKVPIPKLPDRLSQPEPYKVPNVGLSGKPVSDKIPESLKGYAGQGRPIGSTNIVSRKASKKLESLGFDPIQEMVNLYHKLTQDIYDMTHDEDGLPKRYSAMAHATLVNAKQKCISELMRYGYARATEGIEVSNTAIAPITINLTGSASDFDVTVTGVKDIEEPAYRGEDE